MAVARVRGTRDVMGKEASVIESVLSTLSSCARQYGYACIQTPIMEKSELFTRSLGDGSDIVMKVK